MPVALPPLELILWNVRSSAPIVVLATLSAVPVPRMMVLPRAAAPSPCAPRMAVKPVPLAVLMPSPLPPAVRLNADGGAAVARQAHCRASDPDGARRLGLAGRILMAPPVLLSSVDAVGDASVRDQVAVPA